MGIAPVMSGTALGRPLGSALAVSEHSTAAVSILPREAGRSSRKLDIDARRGCVVIVASWSTA